MIFPVAFWEEVYARKDALAEGGRLLLREYQSSAAWFGLLLKGVAYLGVLEALVSVFVKVDTPMNILNSLLMLVLLGSKLLLPRRLHGLLPPRHDMACVLRAGLLEAESCARNGVGSFMCDYEHIYHASGHENGESEPGVRCILPVLAALE